MASPHGRPLLWAILYHSRRTLNCPSDKAFQDVCPSMKGRLPNSAGHSGEAPDDSLLQAHLPVRFWENSALAITLLQVIQTHSSGIGCVAVAARSHRDHDVLALFAVEILHPQQHLVLLQPELGLLAYR